MKEIGGFFELELRNDKNLYHKKALAFNSGTSALLFYLNNNDFNKVYLPYYTCASVIEALKKLDIDIIFYRLNEKLLPDFDLETLKENHLLILNNYFGLSSERINLVSQKVKHCLIDAAQSFYYKPNKDVAAFNSVRKFFGVPDGGFLYSTINTEIKSKYNLLNKTDYCTEHLVNRLEFDAKEAYALFKKNEALMNKSGIGKMSNLTKKLLLNCNFLEVKARRIKNFKMLHENLKNLNKLNFFKFTKDDVPMCYPLLIENGELIKKYLVDKKIYIPTYWPQIIKNFDNDCELEYDLVKNLVCLPIDQRYKASDMNHILGSINDFVNA